MQVCNTQLYFFGGRNGRSSILPILFCKILVVFVQNLQQYCGSSFKLFSQRCVVLSLMPNACLDLLKYPIFDTEIHVLSAFHLRKKSFSHPDDLVLVIWEKVIQSRIPVECRQRSQATDKITVCNSRKRKKVTFTPDMFLSNGQNVTI